MKTAKLRPKKDKNTPFSSVLISSPGRGRGRGRVTELKYVVLEPVCQIIRPLGWSLRV